MARGGIGGFNSTRRPSRDPTDPSKWSWVRSLFILIWGRRIILLLAIGKKLTLVQIMSKAPFVVGRNAVSPQIFGL